MKKIWMEIGLSHVVLAKIFVKVHGLINKEKHYDRDLFKNNDNTKNTSGNLDM